VSQTQRQNTECRKFYTSDRHQPDMDGTACPAKEFLLRVAEGHRVTESERA
jgi:hypothetical protein